MHQPESDTLAVRRSSFLRRELGVFAKCAFGGGEVLFTVKGPIIPRPTVYSFSVGLDRHIDPRREDGSYDFGHYINHSCDPNTFTRIVDGDHPFIEVIARRNIKAGEELTFDYASLERETVTKTKCKCLKGNCRGSIHGYKDLPDDIAKRYREEGMIPKHLLS